MPRRGKAVGTRGKRAPGALQAESLTLSNLAQVKVLADPLRLRILEAFCQEERTTMQVAERLGEKATKLYHHVEALERVGLIRLSRTRQNRGTLEKYYVAVARTFRADSRIFSAVEGGSRPGEDALQGVVSNMLERTADEIRGLIARGRGTEGIQEQGVLSHLEVRASEKEGRRIQSRLMKMIKSLEGPEARGSKHDVKSYRLTLVFYPLDAGRGR